MRHFNFRSIIRLSIILMISIDLQLTLNAQTKPDGSAPQFLFPEFSTGKVRLKNGNIQSLELNYNTVSEKIVYKKDDKIYDVVNTEIIDTVFIKESKFVPAGKVFMKYCFRLKSPCLSNTMGNLSRLDLLLRMVALRRFQVLQT